MFPHLHVHTHYSFLDGGSSVKRLVERAAALGMDVLAITDHNNVSGALEFHRLAKAAGIKPIQGVEITLDNGHHLTLLAKSPIGYRNICSLLTAGHLNSPRGEPRVPVILLPKHSEGLFALSGCRQGQIPSLVLQGRNLEAEAAARWYKSIYGHSFFIEIQNDMLPHWRQLNTSLQQLGDFLGIRTVATGNVHYSDKSDFPIHDILVSVKSRIQLGDVHPARRLNDENYLFSYEEALTRFSLQRGAIDRAREIAEACEIAIGPRSPLIPTYKTPDGSPSDIFLEKLVFEGALERYGKLSEAIGSRLDYELSVIRKLQLADYFLFVWDVARYARESGIRYEGRGSAADSAVVYCLKISNVDSISRGMMFERFLSLERAQLPDIDIDFDSRERDKVSDYIYDRYGHDHVATVCTFSRYHARSAIRDIGKVMGFGAKETDILAKQFPYVSAEEIGTAIATLPEIRDSGLPLEKYSRLFELCSAIAGFPRHVGTHLGGVVVCRDPIATVTPLQYAAKGVVITQFDKDYIEDLGLIKLDLLSLRTLSAVEDAHNYIKAADPDFSYDKVPENDSGTFTLLRSGKTMGVFQLESPGQRALQSRLGAEHMEDIVASVALIRPGPIEGNMVEPFIARRRGVESISYLHPMLESILSKTFGVVLYQEQVIQIAMAIGGFSAGEADELRRVMGHCRSKKDMEALGKEFTIRAVANGVDERIAQTICTYIVSYAGYGFCEAHAMAFANTSYKTAYLIEHHPAEFFAAILNNQPMGYYDPRTICVEARRRGVRILGPDINISSDQYSASSGVIRVSLKQVRSIGDALAKRITRERQANGQFTSMTDLCLRVKGVTRGNLENMVLSGCFDSVHPGRRKALWLISQAVSAREHGMFGGNLELDGTITEAAKNGGAAEFTDSEKLAYEYLSLGFSPDGHIVSGYRRHLKEMGVLRSSEVDGAAPGGLVRVAGLSIRPHRPHTKSGKTMVLLCLEDEDGLVDVIVNNEVYEIYGSLIFTQPALVVEGRLEKRGTGFTVTAMRVAKFPSRSSSKES